ncbi:hypothetical protein NY547_13220 [Cnuibacter physcomitrellae]|uniref:hypothetical protein n=1 Tax=Cnuibacter physcomitrellae TaxID=1619308 RepID=UPI002175F801|nr:hypothetical protein [Cnuibacter physcomitrellae]MCS5498204.1 hypothetical protein [Cnuibacter physcomitrellae]
MSLSIDDAPHGVAPDAWLRSTPGEPQIGDLWLLSWDTRALGLVVVSGVAPTFILGWPVTLSGDQTFPPAIRVEGSPLGEISVWPSRETGVGNHLLHRRFGTALSARTMHLLADAFEDGTEPVLPFATSDIGLEEREAASDQMVDSWETINLNVWPVPRPGITPLDADVLRATGILVGDLADILSISVPAAVSLYNGESVPTPFELEVLVAALGVPTKQLLRSHPDAETVAMLAPDIKEDLVEISRRRAIGEEAARDLVRSQFALAARSDGDARSRLDAAIQRVLGEIEQ